MELKTIKPKRKKIKDKIFTQYPHILIKRIFHERTYYAIIINHNIPDKSRHKIAIVKLSCNLISQLILRKFRRKHLSILPTVHYVFFNHHIINSRYTFKLVMVRLVTKPNVKVLIIINDEEIEKEIALIHKDHNTYDIIKLPSKSMLLFVHTFKKDDPFVRMILTQQKARIEKKRKVGAIVYELKQLAIIDSNYSYIPINQLEKKLRKINPKLRNRILKHLSKLYSNS